jgi:hypothetical protein
MRSLILSLSIALSIGALSPASANAAGRNVLLARGRTEPVVAVDPSNPSIIVAGSNTNYGAPVAGTYPTAHFTSHDGGRSFTFGGMPVRGPYTTNADPTIAFASSGTAFYSYLGETPAYCSNGGSAVLLTTSTDGGRSFRYPTIVDSNPADDKPNMVVESERGARAHVFVTWTRWHSKGSASWSDIWIARSLNGGQNFSRPKMLKSSSLNNFGTAPLVVPGHRIYVFWSVFPDSGLTAVGHVQIFLRVSTDDGAHFGPARRIAGPFRSIPEMDQPGSLRSLTMPAVGVSNSGVVYVAWSQVSKLLGQGAVNADIELIRSTNGGVTWSRARRVNDVRRGDRFMPSLSVLPDGSVGLAFYDRRNHPWELDTYAAHATFAGGFRLAHNLRLNRTYSSISDIYYIKPGSTCFSPGRFFGDYIGTSSSTGQYLCAVWADTQLHVSQETDVWFTRVKLPAFSPSQKEVRVHSRHGASRLSAMLHDLAEWIGLG